MKINVTYTCLLVLVYIVANVQVETSGHSAWTPRKINGGKYIFSIILHDKSGDEDEETLWQNC